jgi:hypothetical protein
MPEPNTQTQKKSSYYKNKRSKIYDFIFGLLFAGLYLWASLAWLSSAHSNNGGNYLIISVIIYIAALIYVITLKRIYLFLGLLSVVLVPLLAMGACFAIFNTSNSLQ